MAFFLTSALIAAVALRASVTGMFAVMTASIAALSMSIFAVNNILTAFMPLHFHKERKVSAVAGFLDCSVYIGAALSGPLAGFLADHFGWPGVINGWIAICVAGIAAALSCKDYRKEP
jgi:sugar phosphate permease